jgi:ATP-dependent 26S proteasome regulatory subunit
MLALYCKGYKLKNALVTIKFRKSRSPRYSEALDLARKFKNHAIEGDLTIIKVESDEIYHMIDTVEKLGDIILGWKESEMNWINNANGLVPSQYINILINCGKYREESYNKDTYCFLDEQVVEGWHCKKLTEIKRHLPTNLEEYQHNRNTYWFEFGEFCDREYNWKINKEEIILRLHNEANQKLLHICPYFSEDKIKTLVNDLPDIINSIDPEWKINEKSTDNGFEKSIKKIGVLPTSICDEKIEEEKEALKTVHEFFPDWDERNKEPKKRYIPTETFNDIGGLDEVLDTIREIIELPIRQPKLFEHLGIKPHKGVLLYGPPGCGKTLIAKAIAHEVKAHFIDIKGPELFNKYFGQSEENLRDVFDEAKKYEPSIIFFDEIDAIAQKRSSEESERHYSRFLNQLLTLMDGFEDYGNVRIIASTNRREMLDEAILRPGRFDYQLEIKTPTRKGCKDIFFIYTSKMPISNNFNKDKFADKLFGLTGSDIAFVSRESAYNCIRRVLNIEDIINTDREIDYKKLTIDEQDFIMALEKIKVNENE